MTRHELAGEKITQVFPAHVEIVEFHGVEVFVISGSEEQVQETTQIFDELYADDFKRTMGDARHTGWSRREGDGKAFPVYQLIVLRKAK